MEPAERNFQCMPRPLALLLLSIATLSQAGTVVFNRDIRPILSDKCFHCHGFDEKDRKAGLRLDIRTEALKPAESGAYAIVPGKPDESELLSRVVTTIPDDIMPPEKLHKPVSKAEAQLLRQWISEGAEYQGHWAFEPVIPPQAANIDRLLEVRLRKENLVFSPEADAETLIRRLSLDITGLPPAAHDWPEMNSKRLSDADYEKLVNRLLNTPAYGEHMAREWLDYARFADSNGFQTDSSRSMWPWRDWVIHAFNQNKPFDQFTIEQIAGDLLPSPTQAQLIATGFNRNHRINGEGGIIDEEWRIENIIDRVETTSFTWLALTMNCARCHDHKYDPITQKDFYSLFAFFNNIEERGSIQGASNRSGGNSLPIMNVTTPEQDRQLSRLKRRVTGAEKAFQEARKQLPQLLAAWEKTQGIALSVQKLAWTLLEPVRVTSKFNEMGAKLSRQQDGSYLAGGANPPKDTYLYDANMPKEGVSGFLLECFTDPSLPGGSLGRYPNGNFVLSSFDVFIQKPGGKPERQSLAKAEADYSQKGYDITSLAKHQGRGWAIDGNTKKENRRAMFLLEKPLSYVEGAQILLRLRHEAIAGHNIGRFRLSSTALPPAQVSLNGSADLSKIRAILATAPEKRTPDQKKELEGYFLATADSPIKTAADVLAVGRKTLAEFENKLPTTMVMKEAVKPREAYILTRGEYDKPAAKVTMAVPQWLHPLPANAPLNRLGLAKWLVSTENPLTARVWVNRQWERLFGSGLCKTTENFGFQAEYPVHPELLDWLAAEFMKSGWDMKHLIKLMVMSKAYRQNSSVSPALWERDPDNRLLARGPRFRLSGEVLRDQALAIGGLLAGRIGGPSVRPYMPEGVWDETSKYGDLRGYKADMGEGLYRRTLYTIWKRTAAPPTMLLFDAPTREICTVKRSRTNTPLQALALLNEVTFVEAQRGLAEQMMNHVGNPETRLAYGYKLATGRSADAETLKVLLSGLDERLRWFSTHPDEAVKAITQGASKPDASLPMSELAAYTTTVGVLMNLDRVVTRD